MKEFRLWCKNKNEWESDLWVVNPCGTVFNPVTNRPYLPKNHVLEESIGIKDKDEKKIYEGDKVTAHMFYFDGNGEAEKEFSGVVIFDNGCFIIKLDDNDDYEFFYFGQTSHHEEPCIKVIGNIHENPELKEKR